MCLGVGLIKYVCICLNVFVTIFDNPIMIYTRLDLGLKITLG